MGTAINHPVPDRVKPSFVISDIWALTLRAEHQSARVSKITYVTRVKRLFVLLHCSVCSGDCEVEWSDHWVL